MPTEKFRKSIIKNFSRAVARLILLSGGGRNAPDGRSARGGDFILGQKYAYVECLELLQYLADPSELHIDFVIEDKYPLE